MYHVLIKTFHANFKTKSGTLTNEWDFITEAPNAKRAGRKAIDEVFGGYAIAQYYVSGVEVWPATKKRASAQ